jgi:hypothetical protein
VDPAQRQGRQIAAQVHFANVRGDSTFQLQPAIADLQAYRFHVDPSGTAVDCGQQAFERRPFRVERPSQRIADVGAQLPGPWFGRRQCDLAIEGCAWKVADQRLQVELIQGQAQCGAQWFGERDPAIEIHGAGGPASRKLDACRPDIHLVRIKSGLQCELPQWQATRIPGTRERIAELHPCLPCARGIAR